MRQPVDSQPGWELRRRGDGGDDGPVHGVIFQELKAFADTLGPTTWSELLKEAGLGTRLYLSAGTYDDADVNALVGAASKKLKLPVPQVLTTFGRYLGPRLLQRHARQVPSHWRTLDVLEHVEDTMHRAVLLAVELAQGLVGFVQYFSGLPVLVVAVHLLGSALVAAAMTWALVETRAAETEPPALVEV